MFPLLETDRLLLREIIEEDSQKIFDCFSNENVTRFYGQDSFTSIEQAKQLIDLYANQYLEKRGIRWGIELKETKEIIGTIGFHTWSTKHKRAEIGYELQPAYWRNGYATEAVTKILSYGFNELGLTRVGAVVFIENDASNRLLTKLGFQKEGILRNYMYQNGKPNDTYVYSLLK